MSDQLSQSDRVTAPVELLKQHKSTIVLYLSTFLLALIFKVLAFFYFNMAIGGSFFVTQTAGPIRWFRYFLLAPQRPLEIQAYNDLYYHYIPYVDAFTHGWNPYQEHGLPHDSITGNYNYGPLYILFISLPTLVGFSPLASIIITNLLTDAVNVVLTLHYARQLVSYRRAMLIAAIYAVSPLMLVYVDYLAYNTPQIIFFTLLFLIFLERGSYDLSTIALAFGFMTKLIPAFFMLPMTYYYWKKMDRNFALRQWLVFAFYSLVLLMPYLVTAPGGVVHQFLIAGVRTGSFSFGQVLFVIRYNLTFLVGLLIAAAVFRRQQAQYLEHHIEYLKFLTFYIIMIHGSFYGIWSRGFRYYVSYYYVFLVLVLLICSRHSSHMTGVALLGIYLINNFIFTLRDAGTPLNYFIVSQLVLPALLLMWLLYDIYRMRQPGAIENN